MQPEPPEHPEPNEPPNAQQPNGSPVRLLTYAEAAAMLGASPDAVRMRCRRGRLVCGHGPAGAGVVWPQPEHPNAPRTHEPPNELGERGAVRSFVRPDARPAAGAPTPAAVLGERVDQLAARLAAAERDRDRWHDEARRARDDAAAASAARDDAERELRVLLARATAPALAAGGNRDIAGQAPDAAGAATGTGSDVPASLARKAPDGLRRRQAGRSLGAWLRRILGR